MSLYDDADRLEVSVIVTAKKDAKSSKDRYNETTYEEAYQRDLMSFSLSDTELRSLLLSAIQVLNLAVNDADAKLS